MYYYISDIYNIMKKIDVEYDATSVNKSYYKYMSSVNMNDYIIDDNDNMMIVYHIGERELDYGEVLMTLTGYDVFNHRTIEYRNYSYMRVTCPYVRRKEYDLIAIDDDNTITYIDEDGNNKDDLQLNQPDHDGKEEEWVLDLKAAESKGEEISVMIIEAMGKMRVVGFRVIKSFRS